ncbi:MAG: hypothetical protein SFZ03_10355 [Candidatus Melainabacteria bacterium]|nr:hypothetical protein [Candidatus Melainabacteria bacterium]
MWGLSTIQPERPETWQNQQFLTVDVDWASDAVLSYSIDLIEQAGIPATWFITHETPLLSRLRENPKFELGIHPNFNKLLFQQDISNGATPTEIVQNLMAIVPEAKVVRSHSMTQSSPLLDVFRTCGLTHESNHFIPIESGVELKPWRHWNGLIKIPYAWEDDVACMHGTMTQTDFERLTNFKGFCVLDVHPIHVVLNTHDLSLYETTRTLHLGDIRPLFNACHPDFGTRSALMTWMYRQRG